LPSTVINSVFGSVSANRRACSIPTSWSSRPPVITDDTSTCATLSSTQRDVSSNCS
jgi:hypothetical protein